MNVLFDNNLKPWVSYKINDCNVYLAGTIFYKGNFYSKNRAANLLQTNISNLSQTDFTNFINSLEGQFSFIYDDHLLIFCFVDKIRSFPLFYSNRGIDLSISNNAIKLLDSRSEIDPNGLLEFRMAGYTIGSKTIYKNLSQISGGEYLVLNKLDNKVLKLKHFQYLPASDTKKNEAQLIVELDTVLDKSIQKLISVANGRKIILPLSAGLDSRLILAKLLQQRYNNLLCYTYGPKYLWEIKEAKQISIKAKVPWIYIELNRSTNKKFHSKSRKDYYLNYSGLSSVPHLADFYVLDKLIKSKNISISDSIITNGQTGDFISGGHITKNNLHANEQQLIHNIITKHFGLWLNLNNTNNMEYLTSFLKQYFSLIPISDNFNLIYKAEYFECHERQFKYVVNGQRAYDYYGLDWYLPFWSDEMLKFWSEINLKNKIDQRLYKNYCQQINPSNLFQNMIIKGQYSLPKGILVLYYFSKMIDKITNKNNTDFLKRRFFNYFGKYAPYYPQASFNEFFSDSDNHRHCVSYWVKYYLEESSIN